jgi:hypothetical protein
MQGLLITDVDSFGGMQARNIVVMGHSRPITLRNSLHRQETAPGLVSPEHNFVVKSWRGELFQELIKYFIIFIVQ